MAKARKKSPQAPSAPTAEILRGETQSLIEKLQNPRVLAVVFGMIFLGIFFLYYPITIEGLDSEGSDVIANIGNTNQVKLYEAETGHKPMWNPNMFGGMPVYHRHNPISWSLDSLIWGLDGLIDWRVWYLFLGALGMFFLARFLGLSAAVSLLPAVAFVLIPHMHALNVVGHFSKLRALMWVPWLLLVFLRFLRSRSLLDTLLFTAVFALQLRTQHYQIVFYAILLLFAVGIYPYLKLAIEKQWGDFLRLNGLFVAAIALVLLIVAQPLFITRDYAPFSTRGGNAVVLDPTVTESDQKGAGFDYATNWSYTVSEWWNLIIPRFHGGTSTEVYEGEAVPQLSGRPFPAYWGELPFTQSYEYLSAILAFLALVAIFFRWERVEVKALALMTLLALLLSLGRNFEGLYKLLFNYLPYFDKFRVPMMILTMVGFNVCVLAAIGLDFLANGGLKEEAAQKRFYILTGIFTVVLILPLLFGSGLSLSSEGELQRYAGQYGAQTAQQYLDFFKAARLEILQESTLQTLVLFLLFAGVVIYFSRRPAGKSAMILGVVVLVGFDLGAVTIHYMKGKFVDLDSLVNRNYAATGLDQIVEKDEGLYRVVPPLRSLAQDSRYTYRYYNVGGYSAAKLQRIQDIISLSLINPQNPTYPLNANVINMMNGKYIFSDQMYRSEDLEYLGSIKQQNLHLYRNKTVFPRAWFVDNAIVLPEGAERIRKLNDPGFDPAVTAILERELPAEIAPADSNARVTVTSYAPDEVQYAVNNSRQSLLVMSEIFYPKGWTATLEDGSEPEILAANHLLRAVVVPPGEHQLTFSFDPPTYAMGVRLSWIGWLIVYAGLAFLLWREWQGRSAKSE